MTNNIWRVRWGRSLLGFSVHILGFGLSFNSGAGQMVSNNAIRNSFWLSFKLSSLLTVRFGLNGDTQNTIDRYSYFTMIFGGNHGWHFRYRAPERLAFAWAEGRGQATRYQLVAEPLEYVGFRWGRLEGRDLDLGF